MLTMDEARARVARGAAHLDQVRPWWHDRIDVGTLTLHDPCGCIVGQLCGTESFVSGAKQLFGEEPNIHTLISRNVLLGIDLAGMELREAMTTLPRERCYQPLQDAWIEAIADRRLKAQAAQIDQTVGVLA